MKKLFPFNFIILGMILLLFTGGGENNSNYTASDVVGYYTSQSVSDTYDDYLELKADGTFLRQLNWEGTYFFYKGTYEVTDISNQKNVVLTFTDDDQKNWNTNLVIEDNQLYFDSINADILYLSDYQDTSNNNRVRNYWYKVDQANIKVQKPTTQSDPYPYLEDLTYLDWNNLKDNKGKLILVVTRTDCGYCQDLKYVLNQVAEQENIPIYVLDLSTISESEYDVLYDQVLSYSETPGATPTTYIYENGNVVDELVGFHPKEETVNFFQKNGII